MARARDIDLSAEMTYAEAARATVAVRAEELFEHADGVLDTSDIERVHDMRVASRRLRAVLEIYAPCFPKDRFRPLLKEVKALADALGARRDPHVLLDRLPPPPRRPAPRPRPAATPTSSSTGSPRSRACCPRPTRRGSRRSPRRCATSRSAATRRSHRPSSTPSRPRCETA